MRGTLTMAALALVGCTRPPLSLDDEVGDAGSSESSTTESSSGDSSTSESNGPSGSEFDDLGFVPPPPFIDLPVACDMIQQDCPEGQKCVAYASSDEYWDASKCVPVTGDQHVGDLCHSDGVVEGTDDCDADSMCWNVTEVDGEQLGVCTAFCGGTADDPVCPPSSSCSICGNFCPNLCIPHCDPVAQDCAVGLACYWANTDFNCIFTTQDIPTGEPCGFINDCAIGNFCADAAALPECAGSACCTNFCDLGLGDSQCAVLPGTVCVPFFELGQAPPGYDHVGLCILPP